LTLGFGLTMGGSRQESTGRVASPILLSLPNLTLSAINPEPSPPASPPLEIGVQKKKAGRVDYCWVLMYMAAGRILFLYLLSPVTAHVGRFFCPYIFIYLSLSSACPVESSSIILYYSPVWMSLHYLSHISSLPIRTTSRERNGGGSSLALIMLMERNNCIIAP